MIFRAIKLFNFGIYAGEQRVLPAPPAKGRPVTLVGGLNGRGKTSLLDAVLLALYGNRSPSLKGQSYGAYLKSLTHKGPAAAEGDSFVELIMVVPDAEGNTELRIRRSWRANVRTDRLQVWRNGLADERLAENWDTHVEDLVPSGVAGLFFFDGEKIAQLAEADDTSESLQQSIRSLMGLDLVERLLADLDTVIRRNQAKIRDSASREAIARLQDEKDTLTKQLALGKQELARATSNLDHWRAKVQEAERAFYEQGGRLLQNRQEMINERDVLVAAVANIKAQAAQHAGGALPLMLVLPLLAQVATTALKEESAQESRHALGLLERRDVALLQHLSQVAASMDVVTDVQTWLERERQELKRLADEPVQIGLSTAATGLLQQLLAGRWEHYVAEAIQLTSEIDTTTEKLENITGHLSVDIDPDKVQMSMKAIATANRTLVEMEHKQTVLMREVPSIERKLDDVDRELGKHASDLGDAAEAERLIMYAARSKETMRKFLDKETDKKIRLLVREMADAFATLTHKESLVDEIRMDPKSLRISLHDAQGQEIPKHRLSSGEKQMLAIAVLWGLARASGRTLPVIIDTPMGRLDSSHRWNFVTKYLPNASHQVMVLSTDTEIVGDYLTALEPHIGRQYLLRYDEAERRTEVTEGYFTESGGVAP